MAFSTLTSRTKHSKTPELLKATQEYSFHPSPVPSKHVHEYSSILVPSHPSMHIHEYSSIQVPSHPSLSTSTPQRRPSYPLDFRPGWKCIIDRIALETRKGLRLKNRVLFFNLRERPTDVHDVQPE